MRLTADGKGRLTCAELFPPQSTFDAKRMPDGTVRLVEMVEKDVPVVKPIRTSEGFLLLPAKIDRKAIRAAIRADRDAR
jgi:hypothetical protein